MPTPKTPPMPGLGKTDPELELALSAGTNDKAEKRLTELLQEGREPESLQCVTNADGMNGDIWNLILIRNIKVAIALIANHPKTTQPTRFVALSTLGDMANMDKELESLKPSHGLLVTAARAAANVGKTDAVLKLVEVAREESSQAGMHKILMEAALAAGQAGAIGTARALILHPYGVKGTEGPGAAVLAREAITGSLQSGLIRTTRVLSNALLTKNLEEGGFGAQGQTISLSADAVLGVMGSCQKQIREAALQHGSLDAIKTVRDHCRAGEIKTLHRTITDKESLDQILEETKTELRRRQLMEKAQKGQAPEM